MKDPYFIRNLFGIEGLDIRWYAVFILLGMTAGLIIGFYNARKRGYNSDMPTDLLLTCLPLAIVCARLYYVIFEFESYKDNLISILYIWEGGIAIYGAVIGSVIGAYIFSRYSKISFGDIIDIGAPGLIIGQAIGRWGNFANQEAFGNLITDTSLQFFPYGVYIDELGEWHQATFFYESMWNLLVFFILMWYFRRAKHKGNVFVLYLVLYGAGRFFIEGLRTDSLWLIPGVIRVSQLLSAVLVVAGTAYLLFMRKKEPKEYSYEGKYSLGYKNPKDEEEGYDEDIDIEEDVGDLSGEENINEFLLERVEKEEQELQEEEEDEQESDNDD
ncbi:MAG: prolipoprotein diacylglyceryl transferase [Clostridia bacterium]|nr:prolipoprotein diacylglyceryl transferase [Clostridia bacterium]